MGKLIGIVMVVTVLAVWLAVWLLPVYVLILASVLVNPRDWREIKWSLRVTSFASGASGVAGTILTQGRPGYISDPVIDTAKRQIIYAHCVAANKAFGPEVPANPFEILTHSEDRQGASVRSLLTLDYLTTTLEFDQGKRREDASSDCR